MITTHRFRPGMLLLCRLCLGAGLVSAAAQAHAETRIAVAGPAALSAALAQVHGGETLVLAAGAYGDLQLGPKTPFAITFATPVTLVSADPADPAVFSSVEIHGAANMTFDSILFDYTFAAGDRIHKRPFLFSECTSITIRNSTFDGDVAKGVSEIDDGLGWGIGLSLRRNTGGRVENNTIFNFHRGLAMGSGFDVVIRGNELHSIRMDGMVFSQMQGIVIEDNYIHDFKRATTRKDHADMIQFWTNNTEAPSTDITIRGNVLMSGLGKSTQSIFMRNDLVDRGLAGPEMFYRNVIIEENVIVNGHTHGITLGASDGVQIRNNTLVRNPAAAQGEDRDRKVRIPRIKLSEDSQDVTITGNLVAAISEARPSWKVRDNLVIQDIAPGQPGYYDKVFTSALTGDPQDLDSYGYLPGGPADKKSDLGSAILQPGALRSRFAPRLRAVLRSRRKGSIPLAQSGMSRQPSDMRGPCLRLEACRAW